MKRRFKFLEDISSVYNWFNSRKHLTEPTKKHKKGWYDMIIDEVTFNHLLKFTEKDIDARIKVPEQKIIINITQEQD